MRKEGATYGSIYGVNTHLADKNTMKEKLTAKDIRKAVKELKKYELKPDGDRLITIEVENPRELTDFFAKRNRKKDLKMMKKIKMEYVGFEI